MADKFDPLAGATPADIEAIRRGDRRGWMHLQELANQKAEADRHHNRNVGEFINSGKSGEFSQTYREFQKDIQQDHEDKPEEHHAFNKGGRVKHGSKTNCLTCYPHHSKAR
jgi:hypothetical protein